MPMHLHPRTLVYKLQQVDEILRKESSLNMTYYKRLCDKNDLVIGSTIVDLSHFLVSTRYIPSPK